MRFTLTDGLRNLLARPANSFGWVGVGTLRFANQGVWVRAPRRAWLGLQGHPRFISVFEIREVYREGSAVRVDLRASDSQRPFFWCWAEDAAAAATLVRFLAAKRSIEFEDAAPHPVRTGPGPAGAPA
ncbi:MAG: hypothetical protein JOZ03_01930, partial [Gammaproteobacteria bacterium]|nr:hypothetical protein [Gammaproteobacteria bacterium]